MIRIDELMQLLSQKVNCESTWRCHSGLKNHEKKFIPQKIVKSFTANVQRKNKYSEKIFSKDGKIS